MPDAPTPAAPHPTESAVLHPASLTALRALDASGGDVFLKRVLSTYLNSLERHLKQARAGQAAGDLAQLRSVTHTLKSSSESIGAIEFARHCHRLERRLREQLEPDPATPPLDDGGTWQADLDQFFVLAQQVRSAVEAELNGAAL